MGGSRLPWLAGGDPLSNTYVQRGFASSLHVCPMLLIIDGLNGLRGGDLPNSLIGGGRGGSKGITAASELRWLPLEIPPGVRIIVATTPDDPALNVLSTRRDAEILQMRGLPRLTDSDSPNPNPNPNP